MGTKEEDDNAFETERESSGCQSITEGPFEIVRPPGSGTSDISSLKENNNQPFRLGKRRKVSSTIDKTGSADKPESNKDATL